MKRLIYQLKHWYHVNRIYNKNFGFNPRILLHDLDKLFNTKDKNYKIFHRNSKSHHLTWMLRNKDKITVYNVFEMLSDWESARFSKPDKQETSQQYAMSEMQRIKQLPLHISMLIIYYSNHMKS